MIVRIAEAPVSEPYFPMRYAGRLGLVRERFDGGHIGESADDPLFLVEFPDGGRDVFWTEELVPA